MECLDLFLQLRHLLRDRVRIAGIHRNGAGLLQHELGLVVAEAIDLVCERVPAVLRGEGKGGGF